eukprot:CAMPEP_0196663968 /NCGR_PEP_ID=MMETSP1086-20130531/54981_1 /TAXON_ID=77921 /ORGANISM="Cyanoptyche  gloeocystis , Strain SAG4.97" /LENGTH=225 /DNA_ID=CAMNT_0042000005 /DNA_START=92 /DNA_END=769 /DNA_ORIENTATION=+
MGGGSETTENPQLNHASMEGPDLDFPKFSKKYDDLLDWIEDMEAALMIKGTNYRFFLEREYEGRERDNIICFAIIRIGLQGFSATKFLLREHKDGRELVKAIKALADPLTYTAPLGGDLISTSAVSKETAGAPSLVPPPMAKPSKLETPASLRTATAQKPTYVEVLKNAVAGISNSSALVPSIPKDHPIAHKINKGESADRPTLPTGSKKEPRPTCPAGCNASMK